MISERTVLEHTDWHSQLSRVELLVKLFLCCIWAQWRSQEFATGSV